MIELPDPEELNVIPKNRALDLLYDALDEGSDEKVDEWFARVHPRQLTTQLLTGALTITCPRREELKNRARWFEAAREVLNERETDQRRIGRLLGGLA